MGLDDLLRETIREAVRDELRAALEEIREELGRGRGAWDGEPYIGHEECARRLGVTPDALYKMPVPYIKFAGRRRYRWSEVDEAVRAGPTH